MNEIEALRKIFVDWTFMHWIMSGYGAVTIFIIGWLIRLQASHNKSSNKIASIMTTNQFLEKDIAEIKKNTKEMRGEISIIGDKISAMHKHYDQHKKEVNLCVMDQKQMSNSAITQMRKVGKQNEEFKKIISQQNSQIREQHKFLEERILNLEKMS